jgi:RhtB (resistance to homoserine/threonine) family protein
MAGYWAEFSQVALAHLLAVASPGPDFAIVLRQSLDRGRGPALWTSLGIAIGILLHVGYSLLGLGLVLQGSRAWFEALRWAGAAYLAWIGLQALRARPRGGDLAPAAGPARGAFLTGLLTNALNPKATLFFVALFALVVRPETPRLIQAGYGLWMAVATGAWFSLVSLAFTRDDVRRRFLRHGHWIDRILGVVFLAFAASLALAALP